ncbi:hypothetical protein [Roseateles sp.]|jgi:hypothetical protein|uniref:hypothetical protein n=1 Tax=Roseateles sp. TaxID=1971397 RepID=UPI00391DE598
MRLLRPSLGMALRHALLLLGLGCLLPAQAQTLKSSWSSQWQAQTANLQQGPLAQAARLAPALLQAAGPARSDSRQQAHELTLRHERSDLPGQSQLLIAATGRLTRQYGDRARGEGWQARAQLQEAALSASHENWSWTAGRKVLSWDVGWGFRPNDMVQQERRRGLLPSTLRGQALLMLEHFDADQAWSLVAVNPQRLGEAVSAAEPAQALDREAALALRWYRRHGSQDVYAYARLGRGERASLGLATQTVMGNSLSLYASLRWRQRHAAWESVLGEPAGLRWQPAWQHDAVQTLLGAQWTPEGSAHSWILEAWHDGMASSDADWQRWQGMLDTLSGAPGAQPPQRRAQMALQQLAPLQRGSGSLQRRNLLLRWSWQTGELREWQLSADLLHHPADGGHSLGLGLQWQGQRWQLGGAWRRLAGGPAALLANMPQRGSLGLWAQADFL